MYKSKKEAAIEYAKRGWQIFTVKPNDKRPYAPLAPNGYHAASNDPATVAKWWDQCPDANIGLNLAGSGLVCVDVDSYKEDCAFEAVAKQYDFPPTLQQTSANGGTHYLYKAKEGAKYPGTLGTAVDVKHNGYLLLSPSTINGAQYRWSNTVDPALAPVWLNEWTVRQKPTKKPTIKEPKLLLYDAQLDLPKAYADAQAGNNWHNNVVKITASLVARGKTDEEIHEFTDRLTLAGYSVDQTRFEVQKMIDGARAKGFDIGPYTRKALTAFPYIDLHKDSRGRLLCNHSNLVKLLTEHPDWKGAFATDEFSGTKKVLKYIPHDDTLHKVNLPRQLEDEDYTRVSMWLNDNGFMRVQRETVIAAVAKACREQSFNLLKDYLESCETTDNIDNELLSKWMMTFLGVEPDSNNQRLYVEAVSRLSLIQAVARVFNPGCKADSVIILEGQQGTGKSTCLSVLFSPDYFGDQLPPMTSKDASSYLKGKWCVELAELEYKRKTEIEAIKAFISRTHENYRPAFGREEIIQPRTCVFWGTTNKDDYLNDETGNRRFLPIETNAIDLEGLQEARDTLWGAAVSAYRAGEAYWLTGDLSKIAATEANDRMEQDPWCELILQYMADMGEASISEAFARCFNGDPEGHRSIQENRRMSKALILCGWEKAGKFTSGNKRNQVRFVKKDRF